ncbi:mediator of RNA polymerase II transcription subunit 10b-like isoform X1 [Primulina eburnea]|uniref:mediator of RNA polymerase II transcription subunit 10b-like isoform X1 n=1 Tax=Primulina eburnea TaxID=1245227 RepID=UPI003C6C2CA4
MDSSSQNTASVVAEAGGVATDGNGAMIQQSNDLSPMQSSGVSTAGISSDDPKQNLTQVIDSIQKTLGILHQLYLTVSSFNVASQLPLLQRMNTLVSELDNMTKLAENCNIQVPMDVIKLNGRSLIDDGKNPDEFTRNVLNSCIAKNQITKGKTDAFKGLRRHLLEELDLAFPDEVEAYREIRASSAAESKRIAQLQNSLPNGDVKVKSEI